MKKTNNSVELTDEQMEKVNGGMKIVVVKSPKFFSPLLRLIFKIKKQPTDNPDTNTVINGPVIADADDTGIE